MITTTEAIVFDAGPVAAIPLGEGRTVHVGGEEIAIFRLRTGEVYAVQASCPHRGGPLADGLVGGRRVVCPLHAFAFDLPTGEPVRNACPALRTYKVRVNAATHLLVTVHSGEGADQC